MLAAMMIGLLIVGGLGTAVALLYLSVTKRLDRMPISQMFGLLGVAAGFLIGPCAIAIHANQQEHRPAADNATKDVPESFFDADRFHLLGKEGPFRVGGETQTGARSVDVLWSLDAGAVVKLPWVTSLDGNYHVENLKVTMDGVTREVRSEPADDEGSETMVGAAEEKLQPEVELFPKDLPGLTVDRLHQVVPADLEVLLRYPTRSSPQDRTYSYSRTQYEFPVNFHIVTHTELESMEVLRSADQKTFPVIALFGFALIAVSFVLAVGLVQFGNSVASYRAQNSSRW